MFITAWITRPRWTGRQACELLVVLMCPASHSSLQGPPGPPGVPGLTGRTGQRVGNYWMPLLYESYGFSLG